VSQIHVPAELRQRYGKLSDPELKAMIRQTLESPGKQAEDALKRWLVALSITEVRPPIKSNVSTAQRRQWAAFALRYLEPLVVGSTEPNTRAAVLNELNDAPHEKLAVLLFGSDSDAEKSLTTFFQKSPEQGSIELSSWQKTAIDALRCPDYSEDVIKTWSRALIEPTISAAIQHFRPVEKMVAQATVQAVVNPTNRSSELYSEIFAHYVDVALQSGPKEYYGQALGCQNEFSRRQALTLTYGRAARNASILALPLSVGAALLWKGELIGLIVPPGIIALVVIVFYTRLVNHVLDTFTWARASVDTLETLLT
jgi:hypothetical protein